MSIDPKPLYQSVHALVRTVRTYGPDHFTPAAGKLALDFFAKRLAQDQHFVGSVIEPAELAAHLRQLADKIETHADELRKPDD